MQNASTMIQIRIHLIYNEETGPVLWTLFTKLHVANVHSHRTASCMHSGLSFQKKETYFLQEELI